LEVTQPRRKSRRLSASTTPPRNLRTSTCVRTPPPDEALAKLVEVNRTAAVIRKDLLGKNQKAKDAVKLAKDEAWRLWRDKELSSSAAGAHKFSKTPQEWTPPEVFDKNGARVTLSSDILEVEADKYKKLWCATNVAPERKYENLTPMDRVVPAKLRRVSKSFKRKTAMAPDAWHPRHYALLPDEGLEVIGILFTILEMCGHLPSQQDQVYIFLLQKLSGGTRPIGLFTSFYRLWSKCRQTEAAAWTSRNDRPYFAAGRARSTIDPVWRQSILNHLTKVRGQHAVSLCWDLRKFYETLSHSRLVNMAKKYEFPLPMLMVALNAYKMSRVVTFEGQASAGVYPTKGIIAGDSMSDALVKLFYIQAFDTFVEDHPNIDFNVYYDDLQIAARGTQQEIIKEVTEAAHALKATIETDMLATLAFDKATVTSDSQAVCDILRAKLGDCAGPPTRLAQFLGIDNMLGRRRTTLARGSKWKDRARAARKRKPRIQRLAAGRPAGALKVFVAGILPAMTYGVEVLGVSNIELKDMQKQALAAMTPATRGRSKSAVFTAKGDPTWRPAVAPVLRWAKEVWEAVSPSYPAAPRISLKQLREVWEVVDKKPPKTWGSSRSAFDAAFLSLRRIGWRFSDPFHVTDDLHTNVSLINTNPKLLAKLLREGVQRQWHRRVAASLIKHGWRGDRICPDPIVNLNHSAWARRNPLAALAANKLFCSAIWTKERAEDAGYLMDDLKCEMCNAADDTLHHRIFDCPCADGARKRHRATFKVMIAGKAADKWLYTKGVMAHPADRCPMPPAADGVDFVWGKDVPEADQDLEKVGGHVAFCDGSAGRHPVAELRRAAWAVAFFSDTDQLQLKVAGPVWRHLPQTAQAAEYLSATAAVQLMKRPTKLVGDCLGVVKAAAALKDEGRLTGLHSGILSDATRPGRMDNLTEMCWMPSHRAVQDGATDYERFLHDGNEVVDEAAGDRRHEVEEEIGAKVLEEEANLCRKATNVLKAAGEVLALWPALPRAMERSQKGDTWSLRVTHTWTFTESSKQWRCTGCGMFSARTFNQGPPANFGRCRPGRLMERMAMAEQNNHEVHAVQRHGVPVFYCAKCGSRGSWLWRNLLSPCSGCVKDNGTARWLRLAAEGSKAIEADGHAPRKRRFARRTRSQKPKATEERTPNPLGNRSNATDKDRRRWELLGGGLCLAPPPRNEQRNEANKPSVTLNPRDAAQPESPNPDSSLKLQPLPADPEQEPEDCPRCAAAVLATDAVCANCGLERASEAPPITECANSPGRPCARDASDCIENAVVATNPGVVKKSPTNP